MIKFLRLFFLILPLLTGCSANSSQHSEESNDSANRENTAAETFLNEMDSIQNSTDRMFEFKRINETDSLALFLEFEDQKMTEEERRCHELIWNLKSVKESAISVRENSEKIGDNFKAATMTDQSPGEDSKWFVIGFYQVNPSSHMTRMGTYRIVRNSLIEQYNIMNDRWEKYVDIDDESFEVFFEKFKLDSIFQLERVQFPFLRQLVDMDNDTGPDKFNKEYIQKKNWKYVSFYYEESFATRGLDAYTQKIKILPDAAVIEIRGVDNGIWIDYNFEKKTGKWVHVSEKDSSN